MQEAGSVKRRLVAIEFFIRYWLALPHLVFLFAVLSWIFSYFIPKFIAHDIGWSSADGAVLLPAVGMAARQMDNTFELHFQQ